MATSGKALIVPLAVLLAVWWLTAGQPAYAQTPDAPAAGTTSGGLPYDEAEAQAIDRMIMCPVCPAETIDQAQVPLARQMRGVIRSMLAEGASRQEILDFFAQRYGQSVIGAPPKSGANLVVWVLPPVGIAAALLAGAWSLRAMSAGRKAASQTAETEPVSQRELLPYLEVVDREMVDRQLAPETDLAGEDMDFPGGAEPPTPGPAPESDPEERGHG